MRSKWSGPVNIGSDEMVTINGLASTLMQIAQKKLNLRHIPGPLGVRGRNSDNTLIEKQLGWRRAPPCGKGLEKLFSWISGRVAAVQQRGVA